MTVFFVNETDVMNEHFVRKGINFNRDLKIFLDSTNFLLPTLHIKFLLMKNFEKAITEEDTRHSLAT